MPVKEGGCVIVLVKDLAYRLLREVTGLYREFGQETLGTYKPTPRNDHTYPAIASAFEAFPCLRNRIMNGIIRIPSPVHEVWSDGRATMTRTGVSLTKLSPIEIWSAASGRGQNQLGSV